MGYEITNLNNGNKTYLSNKKAETMIDKLILCKLDIMNNGGE